MDNTDFSKPVSVKLSGELVRLARVHAAVQERSVPKQIEYWAKIGRIAQENPDLPYEFITGVIEGIRELDDGLGEPFTFQHIKPKHGNPSGTKVQEDV